MTTVQNGITTVERYSLLNDGTMMEQVTRDRPPARDILLRAESPELS